MTSEDKDNKIKNLDSFFSMNKEESPKSQSPTFKFDYNQIMTSFEHNQEYQFIIEQSKQLHKTEHIEIFKIIDLSFLPSLKSLIIPDSRNIICDVNVPCLITTSFLLKEKVFPDAFNILIF